MPGRRCVRERRGGGVWRAVQGNALCRLAQDRKTIQEKRTDGESMTAKDRISTAKKEESVQGDQSYSDAGTRSRGDVSRSSRRSRRRRRMRSRRSRRDRMYL